MQKLLNDKLNLEILEQICYGIGVEVNISQLSYKLKKHRKTIKSHVDEIFEHKIINGPIYPFLWFLQEYPLLVLSEADLPRNEDIDAYLKEDEHIFAAFHVRHEEYNTLLIEMHEDIYSYGEWRKKIVLDRKIPPREMRYPSDSLFFSTKHILKYQPFSPVYLIEKRLQEKDTLKINGLKINTLNNKILKHLMTGKCIRTNENLLAQNLDVHRITIERRIQALLKEKIITMPVCRFPNFFVPPNYILVYALLEIRKSWDKIINAIKLDHSIPLAFEANIRRYNLLLFKVFYNVEEQLQWEKKLDERFTGSVGAMRKIILSPEMATSIDQQKVSLNIIKKRKILLHGKELMDSVKGTQ